MAEDEIQANIALMAFSDSEISCSKNCLQNYEALKKQYDDLLVKLDDTAFKASTYKRALSVLEAQVVKYKESKVLFSKEIALLKRSVGHKEYLMGLLRTELEKVKEEKTVSSSVKSPLKVDKDWKEKFFCPANQVRVEAPKKTRENNDAPIIEDWVSDDEDDVESIPKVEKKTIIPIATKKEFVKPETPIRRSVSFDHIQYICPKTSHPSAHKHMAPRAVLMKTGLKSVNTARPVNTVRSVNASRPFSTARSFNTVRHSYTTHPKSIVHCARPRTYFQNQAQSTVHRPFYKRTTLTKRSHYQKINTGSREVSTVVPEVNTAAPEDLVGP
ncbi:hypothetical protein Tco_1159492, partial [Tanacetum coccineum]